MRAPPDVAGARGRHAVLVYWDHMTGAGWTMMILWTVVLLALVGLVASALVRSGARAALDGSPPQSAPDDPPGPRRILDERLARGEIDVEEYRRLRRALDAPTATSA